MLFGIDKGWAYAPGADSAAGLRQLIDTKAATLPGPLAGAFAQSMAALPPAPTPPAGPA